MTSVSSGLVRILLAKQNGNVPGPAIFIDRDGVINLRRPDDYVLEWSQFVFVPGICEALRQLSTLGLPMIVISNQAAVGKGLLTPSGLEHITRRMHDRLLAEGTGISGYYYCIHQSNEGCACRKPRAGLLLQAALDFNIDLTRSIFIGDSQTDVQAARSAKCEPILFGGEVSSFPNLDGAVTTPAVASSAEMLYEVAVESLRWTH